MRRARGRCQRTTHGASRSLTCARRSHPGHRCRRALSPRYCAVESRPWPESNRQPPTFPPTPRRYLAALSAPDDQSGLQSWAVGMHHLHAPQGHENWSAARAPHPRPSREPSHDPATSLAVRGAAQPRWQDSDALALLPCCASLAVCEPRHRGYPWADPSAFSP